MNMRTNHKTGAAALAVVLACLCLCAAAEAQLFPRTRRDTGPKPKNVHGIVQDARGNPLPGARVFLRNTKTNIVRTLETDETGQYKVFALPPAADYELHAEYKGKSSDKKYVSSFLNREDNVLNFELDVAVIDNAAGNAADDQSVSFKTYDLVELHASFDVPLGVPAPIPAVLLLHGYGEERGVWNRFSKELLNRGWAVMSLDLRGHGDSKVKNGQPIQASPDWRTSQHEFPVDLEPALDWLKSQARVDNRKIVIIGYDVGANLALLASGRFPEVRTAVAIKPNLDESLALAGSAQDFHPRSTLVILADASQRDRFRSTVAAPSRVVTGSFSGGTAEWTADQQVQNDIFQWLKETY